MGVSNTVQQLSVFLENREGRLEEVLDVLAKSNVNIVALSLADTSDYGMLRMIVSDPNKGKAVLKENGRLMMKEIISTAGWRTRASPVAGPPGKMPVRRPSHITAMRCDRRRTSGSSEEITMMDFPAAARSRMMV